METNTWTTCGAGEIHLRSACPIYSLETLLPPAVTPVPVMDRGPKLNLPQEAGRNTLKPEYVKDYVSFEAFRLLPGFNSLEFEGIRLTPAQRPMP